MTQTTTVVIVEMHAFTDGKERHVEIPTAELLACKTPEQKLERVFYYGQNDFQSKPLPSVSVGDVVQLAGLRWAVMGCGFRKIPHAFQPPNNDGGQWTYRLHDAPLDPPGYAARVFELENEGEGMSTSDAQGVADAEFAQRKNLPQLTLTKLESEILNHRLDVPDAVSDAMTDVENPEWTEDQIGEMCDLIRRRNWAEIQSHPAKLFHDVLFDVVDGSTYYGASIGNETPQQLGIIHRAGVSLAAKVSELIGREVNYPRS